MQPVAADINESAWWGEALALSPGTKSLIKGAQRGKRDENAKKTHLSA
jgi:hypothetical protein